MEFGGCSGLPHVVGPDGEKFKTNIDTLWMVRGREDLTVSNCYRYNSIVCGHSYQREFLVVVTELDQV